MDVRMGDGWKDKASGSMNGLMVGQIVDRWIDGLTRGSSLPRCLRRYRLHGYILALGMEGLCCMFLPSLDSFLLLLLFSLVYGYFDGAYVALLPVVASSAVETSLLTSALGAIYFLHAVPYLVSPPIGGMGVRLWQK